MKQALIIGECGDLSQDFEDRLWDAGFGSLIHVLDEVDARAVVRRIRLSLIVVLPDGIPALSAALLLEIGDMADAPVLVAANDAARALRCLEGSPTSIPVRHRPVAGREADIPSRPKQGRIGQSARPVRRNRPTGSARPSDGSTQSRRDDPGAADRRFAPADD